MLNKGQRIRLDKDFDRIFKNGQSFYNKNLRLKAVNATQATSRLGVLISTKVSKRAVVRNKIKRQLKWIFNIEQKKFVRSGDLVVVVFSEILDKSFLEIREILIRGFKKLGLYG